MISAETLASILTALVLASVLLHFIAPVIAKRWPGSWADVLAAYLVRQLPEALAFLTVVRGLGGAAPLVRTKADDAELEGMARKAYETFGDAAGWHRQDGAALPQWADLSKPQREAWKTTASTMRQVLGSPPAKKAAPPPLPLVMVLMLCGCTWAEAKAAIATGIEIAGAVCDAVDARHLACKIIHTGGDVMTPAGAGAAPPLGAASSEVRFEVSGTEDEIAAFCRKNTCRTSTK